MLSINNLTKYYGSKKILNNISFDIREGEVISIIGPSGSGKSTILRCIMNLIDYEEGEINIPSSTKIGMVFQNYNLFPNMSIIENLVYAPIKVLKIDKKTVINDALLTLKQVGLEEIADKLPHSLSGGQRQRAAIARTLLMKPNIILFDEATSALDPENVKEVLFTIKNLVNLGVALLIVTHEMQFAKEISDSVIFIDNGIIIEKGNVSQIFIQPQADRLKLFLSKVI